MRHSKPSLLDVADALAKLREKIPAIGPAEETGVDESIERVLARDIYSQVDIPAHDLSLMDGYALRSASATRASRRHPVQLKVTGELYPSSSPNELRLRSGDAAYVATGAPLPRGADSVVMVENVERSGSHVTIFRKPAIGEFVAKRGEDIRRGFLLRKGTVLRAQDVGALRGIGRKRVQVAQRPRVGILSVGDELVRQASQDPTMAVGNYALILSLFLRELPVTVEILGICPDRLERVRQKVKETLDRIDLLITTGGTSAGAKDIVVDALASVEEGGWIHRGLRLRPGHTTAVGLVRGKPIVALPGVIIPAVAGLYALAVPLLEHLIGLPQETLLPKVPAVIDSDTKKRNVLSFQPLRLSRHKNGLVATPVGGGAGLLSRLIDSNGFVLVPPKSEYKRGETIDVTPYASSELTHIEEI